MAGRTVLPAHPHMGTQYLFGGMMKIGIWLFLFLGFADNGVVGRAFAAGEDRIGTNGLEPEAAPFLAVRGFYMPSYDVNGLVGGATETQLNALRAQAVSPPMSRSPMRTRPPTRKCTKT